MDDDRQDLHESLRSLHRKVDQLGATMSDIQSQIDALAAAEDADVASIQTAVDAIRAELAAEIAKPDPSIASIQASNAKLDALSAALTPPAPAPTPAPVASIDPSTGQPFQPGQIDPATGQPVPPAA